GHERRQVREGHGQPRGDALGHLGLAGPGTTQHKRDHQASARRLPSRTARCAALASRDPHRERGPPYASAGPDGGHRTATASEGVPVAAKPASHSAWDLASVTVMTALTSAARDRRWLSTAMMFTVPVAGAVVPVSAAQLGWLRPTVAATATPSSRQVLTTRTSTAVSMPIPGPSSSR